MSNREKLIYMALGAIILSLFLLSLKLTAGLMPEPGPERTPAVMATSVPMPTPTPAPISLALADQSGHPALMSLEEDGLFHPEDSMTRGELFQLLVNMIDGLPARETADYSDLAAGDAAYRAVSRLYDAGLLEEAAGEAIRPEEPALRGDLAAFLSRLAARLDGEEKDLAQELAQDVTNGYFSESGTAAGSGEALTRREIAVILERLAGRIPNSDSLFLLGLVPADLDRDDQAWDYMADAVRQGVVPVLEPGPYRLDGWLYAAGEDGSMITDGDYGLCHFGPDGAYTTGDGELDQYLRAALEASGANELTGRAALEAVYLYVKRNFEYLVTEEDMTPEEVGAVGWENERALRFFRNGGGTCYGYAAAFGLLARCLGEEAHIVSAQINYLYGAHSFVVIPEDGVNWIYDVELEDARPYRFDDLGLFRVENFSIYDYWYTPDW